MGAEPETVRTLDPHPCNCRRAAPSKRNIKQTRDVKLNFSTSHIKKGKINFKNVFYFTQYGVGNWF
jgi:hypothetical protein